MTKSLTTLVHKPDYSTFIRAHVDYALMALFNLGFYGSGVELPVFACWCVAIGGFTNPSIFWTACRNAFCFVYTYASATIPTKQLPYAFWGLPALAFALHGWQR
jgi:hypothetical protein